MVYFNIKTHQNKNNNKQFGIIINKKGWFINFCDNSFKISIKELSQDEDLDQQEQ